MKEIASDYIGRGWSPIPIPLREKNPGFDGWEKLRVTADNIDQHFNGKPLNIGVLTGEPSGGLTDVDLDHPLARELAPKYLPPTGASFGRATNPESHLLYVARGKVKNRRHTANGVGTIVELRSTGLQTVMPGSLHKDTGERIEWHSDGAPAEVDGEALAASVSALFDAVVHQLGIEQKPRPKRSEVAKPTRAKAGKLSAVERAELYVDSVPGAISGQGGHNATFALACALVIRFDLSIDDALPIMLRWNSKCQPEWTEQELTHKLESADALPDERGHLLNADKPGWNGGEHADGGEPKRARDRKPERRIALNGDGGILDETGRTDMANARVFGAMHGDDVRWCDPWGKWAVWDGKHWVLDSRREIDRRAKLAAKAQWHMGSQAMELADAALGREILSFLKMTSGRRGLDNMMALARSEPGIPILPAVLDTDPWLLNVANGTLDLRTGKLREHDRADYITKLCPVNFNPAAKCPNWESMLAVIMDNHAELIEFLQRAVGYSLTGNISEHALFVLHGVGANGKSTFLNGFLDTLGGDYAIQAADDLLMAKKGESHPTERADLHGKRFVCGAEVEEGRRMAEALVKRLTGGELIKARRMREDFWEFSPTHKLWLAVNHKPVVRGTDGGIWRRIRLVPFTVTIPPEKRDKRLPEKLAAEREGILAWAVRGCLNWQRQGLGEPEAVRAATDEYRSEMDVIGGFLTERCMEGTEYTAKASEVYNAYRAWCERGGEYAVNQRRFGAAMTEKGFERYTNNGKWYRSLGLLSDWT